MEVPLLRQWITQMVHDSLKLGNIPLSFHCFQGYNFSMIPVTGKVKRVVSVHDLYKAF